MNTSGPEPTTWSPRSPTARKLLLLGLGNDLLSDDAVGLRVAAAIRAQSGGAGSMTIVESAEMGLSLLDLIAGFDNLILVDAIQTGAAPAGFVHEIDGGELRSLPSPAPHFFGVGELLALGRELGLDMPRRVKVLAVEVSDPFTLSPHLTPELEAALPQIVERVARASRGWL